MKKEKEKKMDLLREEREKLQVVCVHVYQQPSLNGFSTIPPSKSQ